MPPDKARIRRQKTPQRAGVDQLGIGQIESALR